MPKQSNNKLVLGGAAGLIIVAALWFFVRSGSADQTPSPTRQPTFTMTDDEPAEQVGRTQPRGSTGGTRLEGPAAAAVADDDDESATQKSKRRRGKKRQRKQQETDEEEEKSATGKKGKKQKFYGK